MTTNEAYDLFSKTFRKEKIFQYNKNGYHKDKIFDTFSKWYINEVLGSEGKIDLNKFKETI